MHLQPKSVSIERPHGHISSHHLVVLSRGGVLRKVHDLGDDGVDLWLVQLQRRHEIPQTCGEIAKEGASVAGDEGRMPLTVVHHDLNEMNVALPILILNDVASGRGRARG